MRHQAFSDGELLAQELISNSVIKFAEPNKMFKMKNGMEVPFYFQNREIPSRLMGLRKVIVTQLSAIIATRYRTLLEDNKLTIAATSSGSAPWAAFIAQNLDLPLVQVRKKKKNYGMYNQIEGTAPDDNFILLIDDVIITGNDSIRIMEILREERKAAIGTLAIMDMQLPEAKEDYRKFGLDKVALFTFKDLIKAASAGNVPFETIKALQNWHNMPYKNL